MILPFGDLFRRESEWTKLATECICRHMTEEVVDQTWDPRVIWKLSMRRIWCLQHELGDFSRRVLSVILKGFLVIHGNVTVLSVFACIPSGQNRFLSGFLESWLAEARMKKWFWPPDIAAKADKTVTLPYKRKLRLCSPTLPFLQSLKFRPCLSLVSKIMILKCYHRRLVKKVQHCTLERFSVLMRKTCIQLSEFQYTSLKVSRMGSKLTIIRLSSSILDPIYGEVVSPSSPI